MPTIDFIKMNGLGNDFVVVDQTVNRILQPQMLATVISDRTYGIGCDQMILLDHSSCADIKMSIFNRDGSESNMCGNALRCVAKYLMQNRDIASVKIEINGQVFSAKTHENLIAVNIGKPKFNWDQIPLASEMNTLEMDFAHGNGSAPSAVNVGNPHIIFFVSEKLEDVQVKSIGPKVEKDPLFVEGINVTFASAIDENTFKVRVWERGTGETLSCGSAACALAAVAHARGMIKDRVANVVFKRGVIKINLLEDDSIEMIGDASVEYNGKFVWKE